MERVFDIPLVIMGPLIIFSLVAIGVIGMLITRNRLVARLVISEIDSEFSGAMFQGICVFYGLALALLAVHVLESYTDVSKIVSNEATAIATLYRDLNFYPEPIRSTLQGDLRSYVDEVIKQSWPLQAQGRIPTQGVELMNKFQNDLMTFQPQGAAQEIFHADTLAAFNRMNEARRMRLDALSTNLPGIMWFVIIFGALISLCSSFFFRVADVRLHGILVGLLAVFIGVVIFMILSLDRPFRGDLAITSAPYQLVYDQLMRQ